MNTGFKIVITKAGHTTVVKDAISRRVMTWESQSDAETFAHSMFALARCDWKNEGRLLPRFAVVPVGNA